MTAGPGWCRLRVAVAAVFAAVVFGLAGMGEAQPSGVRGAAPDASTTASRGRLQSVATAHATVLFADPALEAMARRTATLAEEAIGIVAGWFGSEPFPVTLQIDASTDVFNALATPVPRPTVALRFVPPVASGLGLGANDWLELLLVHELAHLAHFARTGGPGPGLGVVGEGVAPPPPAWLVEGLATWLESELTGGGRRDDPLTAGLLATLATGDDWPTLEAASIGSVPDWPGGRTRYLLGAAFLDALIREHGWSSVLEALKRFNMAPPWATFAEAWRATTGADLDTAWDAWRQDVTRAAEERAAWVPAPPDRWTDDGGTTGLPTLSPGGDRLAWRTGTHAIGVAALRVDAEGRMELGEVDRFETVTPVASLDWLDDRTLVYTRTVPTATSRFADVFALDLATGREARWTVDERAHFARGDPGSRCVSWVRIAPGHPVAILERCGADEPATVRWEAPPEAQIVGYDRSVDGRAVVSVWASGSTGIAVLAPTGAGTDSAGAPSGDPADWTWAPTWLTWDPHLDLDPVWTPAGTIRFRSDRTARFEVHEIDPRDGSLIRWTDTLGGALEPAGAHAMVVLGAEGFDLAAVPSDPRARTRVVLPVDGAPDSGTRPRWEASSAPGAEALEARPYDPWPSLAPFGWWPTRFDLGVAPLRLAAEAQVLGQDAAARHAWTVTVGLDTALTGPLGPAYASGTYTWNPTGPFATWAPPATTSAWLQAGAWPHAPHLAPVTQIALGARAGGVVRFREAGLAAATRAEMGFVRLPSRAFWEPDLRLDAVATTAGADRWGYPGRGARWEASVRWTPTPIGPAFGAWADGTLRWDGLGGAVAGSLRAGYRQAPPIPLALEAWAVVAGMEGRWHVPVAWRYGDGRYALERMTVSPAVRSWWDARGLGLGADLTIGADLLVSYGVPATLWVRGGWAQQPWFGVGVGTPF